MARDLHGDGRRRGARLPPVLPVVLYNGKARWRKAVALTEVLEPLPGELGSYQPEFRYLLIDEGSLSRERLEAMRNLVALLFRLETSAGAADAAAGLVALNEQLEARGTPEVELAFDVWLEQVLVPGFRR
ncbi:MAG: Rpn family recombination-promoting nuclease/putative transposase [bacterium]|nr:Rpn family recombination-promoting nuclease/putative transposase [bacterium]